jgi:hypothetical protein
MLIKFEDDQSVADLLRAHYGEKTASKGYQRAAREVIAQHKEIRRLRGEVEALQERLLQRDQLIEGARSAAALLLEKTGQKDLL